MSIRYFTALSLLFVSVSSFAVGKEGGGGGAYDCTNYDGKGIHRVLLADLWDADLIPTHHVVLKDSPDKNQQIADALDLLTSIFPEFGKAVLTTWKNMKFYDKNVFIPPPMDNHAKVLPPIEWGCTFVGIMYYDGQQEAVLENQKFYDQQKMQTEFAASETHEAIYKVLRDRYNFTDSDLARKINGCLYTSDPVGCLGLKPQTEPVVPPEGKEAWLCTDTNRKDSFYLVHSDSMDYQTKEYKWDREWTSDWTILLKQLNGKDVIFASKDRMDYSLKILDYTSNYNFDIAASYDYANDSKAYEAFAPHVLSYMIDLSHYPKHLRIPYRSGVTCELVQPIPPFPKNTALTIKPGIFESAYDVQSKSYCNLNYQGYDARTGLMSIRWINNPNRYTKMKPCLITGQTVYFKQVHGLIFQGVDPRSGEYNDYRIVLTPGGVNGSSDRQFALTAPANNGKDEYYENIWFSPYKPIRVDDLWK